MRRRKREMEVGSEHRADKKDKMTRRRKKRRRK
jgi:hypothetical protein